MKRILCFGDSNTWGYNPSDGSRFSRKERWPKTMGVTLGPEYMVVEDACCGRTVLDLNSRPELNSVTWIRSVIKSYIPLYAAIISLGINDVFDSAEISLGRITDGLKEIVYSIIRSHQNNQLPSPHIILMTPVMPSSQPEEMSFYQMRNNKAAALIAEYALTARETGSHCLDISGLIASSASDGLHIDSESHIKLGYIVADFIRRNLNES